MIHRLAVHACLGVVGVLATVAACSSGSGSSGGSSSGSSSGGPSSGSSGGGSCDMGGIDGGVCPIKAAEAEAVPSFSSCANLMTPTVSFEKDIRPILVQSCSITTGCHGQPASAASAPGVVFFGAEDGGTPIATILANIVNAPSPENPGMSLVTPGAPENSYLMHKLDGDHCRYAAACNATGQDTFLECGLPMPYGLPALCLDSQSDCVKMQTIQQQYGERDQIRRWIAQGSSAD